MGEMQGFFVDDTGKDGEEGVGMRSDWVAVAVS
jgi:hypothetical protein